MDIPYFKCMGVALQAWRFAGTDDRECHCKPGGSNDFEMWGAANMIGDAIAMVRV